MLKINNTVLINHAMKKSILLMFVFLSTGCFISLSAQMAMAQNEKGKIAGKLTDAATNEDMIGATIQIEGTSTGVAADMEGKYSFSLEPGNYNLIISFLSYKTIKIPVEVKANEITYVTTPMEENTNVLQDVVITYTVEKSSALALLATRKNAAQVSDGVSADQIRKTPDRTTSDVLKRVTGASIQDGKFAIIRGMNDRYNAGYLDGALLPSTESDRKAFAFDVVPAGLLDNIQVIKAGTPDLVGDFGGGIIKINTKSIPEELTQTLTIGLQTNSLTTFKSFTQFKTYPGEDFNILSNKRDLPSFETGALKSSNTFPSSEEKTKFAAISKEFNNDWSNTVKDAMPNTRFAYSLGFPIALTDTKKLGVILALNYSNTCKRSEAEINTFDGSGQVSAFKDQTYSQNISSGGILNLNYVGEHTEINFRNLLNINTDNNTIVRGGIGNIEDALEVKNLTNLINYNRLYNSILSLKQTIGKNLFNINASVNYSNVNRQIPDYRIINYTKTPDFDNYQLALGDFFNSSTGRFASNLNENLYGGSVDISKQFDTEKLKTDVKAGVFTQQRDRTFWGRSFVYNGNVPSLSYDPAIDLGEQNIAGNKLYLLEKTSDDISYYHGKSQLNALYVMADQKYNKLRAVYGVRYEIADINMNNDKTNKQIASIKEGVYLPSVNLTYSLTDKMNLRAGFYKSVNRPEFRELAPFAFFVFDKNAEIKGNADLKIANLNNYELRWELYPTGNELISAGAFYKTIENPVEFSLDVTQPFTTFTYSNGKSAKVYGVELEFRKKLDFISHAKIFNDIVFFSNLALIKSELSFANGSFAKTDRPLQGQSPYVLNLGLQYDNKEIGWFGSVVFNQVGRRIAYVGVDPKYGDTRQDIYEAPRGVVDIQVGKNIGKFNLKFTLGDLLHHDLIYYQDTDHNGTYNNDANHQDRKMFSFTNGMTMNLSAGLTF